MERQKKKKKKEEKSREALMQSGDELQLLSGSDTNRKRQEAEMKRRASALGVTRIRDEDVTGTALHAKCLEIKPERPDSDGLDGEYQGRRTPRSESGRQEAWRGSREETRGRRGERT